VAVTLSSSDGNAIRYVLPVCGRRYTPYNGRNRPESKMMRVSSTSLGGGTGSEACRLRLHLVYGRGLKPCPQPRSRSNLPFV